MDFVLEAQLPAFEVGNMGVIDRGRCQCGMELLLQSDMLLFERFKMSLNSHMTLPSS